MKNKLLVLYLVFTYCFTAKSQYNLVDNPSFEILGPDFPMGAGCDSDPEKSTKYWNNVSPWALPHEEYLLSGDFCIDIHGIRGVGTSDVMTNGGAIAGKYYARLQGGEFICAPLKTPLEVNKLYYVEFYVSSGSLPTKNGGLIFTDKRPSQCGADGLVSCNGPVHVEIPTNLDIRTWAKVHGYFSTNVPYSWIVLGSFYGGMATYNIDDIKVICVGPSDCPDKNYIQNTTFQDVGEIVYRSEKLTIAGKNVTNSVPSGNVVIGSRAIVEFKSHTEVQLKAGFSVEKGATFNAKIAPCWWECDPRLVANAGADGISCNNQILQLGTSAIYGNTYSWSATPASGLNYLSNPTVANPTFNPPSSGDGYIAYQLTVTNKCGISKTDDVVISYNASSTSPTFSTPLPNVFTPNGDGVNDLWCFGFTRATQYSIDIYDSWGVKVFKNSGTIIPPSACVWNGGNKLDGTYNYVLTITACNGSTNVTNGNIRILSSGSSRSVYTLQNLEDPKIKIIKTETEVLISPNPTNGKFIVDILNLNENAELTVLNFSGQIILNVTLTKPSTEIDLSSFNSGIYTVKINSNAMNKAIKIIKQ